MIEQNVTVTNEETQDELSEDQLKDLSGGTGRPPSGDANPSDLTNSTVDTSDVINPHPDK